MGIGHHSSQQLTFYRTKNKFAHGGELRKLRIGRGHRPISVNNPIHVVFKVNRQRLRHRSLRSPGGFKLVHSVIAKYSKYFAVKIEQLSIQHDHLHLLIRSSRRRNIQHYFRVVAGQIAQRLEFEGLLCPVTGTPKSELGMNGRVWKHRPFSRVVFGRLGYRIVRNYIQLNEKEVLGIIPYRKTRLRGLSSSDWKLLWS